MPISISELLIHKPKRLWNELLFWLMTDDFCITVSFNGKCTKCGGDFDGGNEFNWKACSFDDLKEDK